MTSSEPLTDDTDPTYTHFGHRDEFIRLLSPFLAIDIACKPSPSQEKNEVALIDSMGAILDYYLPLPGLLDPSLDLIVTPLMDVISKSCIRLSEGKILDESRLARVGRLVNWVIKVRGWKAIVPYFPSDIQYLSILVDLLSPSISPSSSQTASLPHHSLLSSVTSWELRSVFLLWLALLLKVPFNLTALSPLTPSPLGLDNRTTLRLFSPPSSTPSPSSALYQSEIAKRVTVLSLHLLHRSGKEGAYSGLVLARLFSRADAVNGLPGFFNWAEAELVEGERENEANFVTSLLVFLAVLPTMIEEEYLGSVEKFIDEVLLPHLRGSRTAAGSGLVRKLVVKVKGRLWIAKLGKGIQEDEDLPQGLEEILDDLMGGLSDKYLARLASLLPPFMSSQIVMGTINLFAGSEDEPVVETSWGMVIDPGGNVAGESGTMGFGGMETTRGEARWHGVCLAIAEMARRGLVQGKNAVGEAVQWIIKALTFDLRRASHSIGSNVRDAAAYVLWSLSRTCSPNLIAPHADLIATSLTCVALFDREVGVRRAASAAYQEGVGRLNLYPEGIDVLSKTDFYSVSVRRTAFNVAAKEVAVHEVYRRKMREFLHNVTLRHWDLTMRVSGAEVLRMVLKVGSRSQELEDSIKRELEMVKSLDSGNVHGALAALAEIAMDLAPDDDKRTQIFNALSTIRPSALLISQSNQVVQASCDLIASTLSPSIMNQSTTQAILDQFIETAIRRREGEVHERLGKVFEVLSGLRDVGKEVIKLVGDLKSIRAAQRQAAAICLGNVQYKNCLSVVEVSLKALLAQLDPIVKADVETRRNAIRSLGYIACQKNNNDQLLLSADQYQQIISAFIIALDDYTTDQRGDVGSWIRIASLSSLSQTLSTIATTSTTKSTTAKTHSDQFGVRLVDEELYVRAMRGFVRLSVEKLEIVREETAWGFARMRKGKVEKVWGGEEGVVKAFEFDPNVRLRDQDQAKWFASAMPLLKTRYRSALVAGLVLSIGSQIQSTSSLAFHPLKTYLNSLDPIDKIKTSMILMTELINLIGENLNSNRVFIPALQTVQKVVESGLFTFVSPTWDEDVDEGESEGVEDLVVLLQKILGLACRGISSMKSIDRIRASMLLTISTLTLPYSTLKIKSIASLRPFLTHRFPRVRAMTAEALYLALEEVEGEVGEELGNALLETGWTEDGVGESEADKVLSLLSRR